MFNDKPYANAVMNNSKRRREEAEAMTEKSPRQIADQLVADQEWDARLTVADRVALRGAVTIAIMDERKRAAKIATKKAETLRRVQQPTEEALRMAELAINTADDIASAIRGNHEQ